MLQIVCSKFIFTGIQAFFFFPPPGRKFLFKLFEAKCDFMINLEVHASGEGVDI